MAEIVFLRLEHSLRELEEMERLKLFSKQEIKKIAKKRKMYEYRLRRRRKNKEDFLQYIEYEICLLLLISKRRKRLLVESKKKEIDNSIAQRINRLFKAVIARYPEDEKLWLNQIDYFKRMKWNDSINALYSKILQVHSRKPNIWVMAAKWQMEENNSYDNARRLFQRGVLINPTSKLLWREYFRMELKYIEMIKKRKEVLQLKNMDTSEEEDAILKGDVVNVVFDNAIEEIPDVEYALSFLEICFEFDFAVPHGDHIIYSVNKKFPDSEDSLDALTKLPLLHKNERTEKWLQEGKKKKDINKLIFKEMCSKYDEAVEHLNTEKMWKFYLNFLDKKLQTCVKEKSKDKIENLIINKMDEAENANCLPPEFINYRAKMLIKKGEKTRGLEISVSAARKLNTSTLWLECLLLHIQNRKSKEVIFSLFCEAINNVLVEEQLEIWKLGIDWLTMVDPEKLMEFFEIGISKRYEGVSFPLKEMYLESTALRDGIKAARNLYNRYKSMGNVSPEVHQKMISIERAQIEPSITHIRAIYEELVNNVGHSNVDVWLQYMHFEAEIANNLELFNMLQWRGKKYLQPHLVQEFQTRITKLFTEEQKPNEFKQL